MSDVPDCYNVLFLCTGNSARSILAESILNDLGMGQFRAFSAGSQPKGEVHPLALALLEGQGAETGDLRSKSWDEFAGDEAPRMDFIFTVCGNAAGETCPVWPGHPATAHWGIDDPAAATGTERECMAAFETAYAALQRRVAALVALPIESLAPRELQAALDAIGHIDERGGE